MGALWHEHFARNCLPCTLLNHGSTTQQLTLREHGRTSTISAVPLAKMRKGSIERLLLTTKAGQIASAMLSVGPYLSAQPVVISTANGLGFPTECSLEEQMPEEQMPKELMPGKHTSTNYGRDSFQHGTERCVIVRGVTTAGAHRSITVDGKKLIDLVSFGETRIGFSARSTSTHAPPSWFSDSLQKLGTWHWESPIDDALHHKFAINCVINPLSADLGLRNGELLQPGARYTQLAALCEETEDALRQLAMWPDHANLLAIVTQVCTSTANNRSSMLQDVMAQRPTELEFLNAELLRKAADIGLSLPLNSQLVTRLSGRNRVE